MQHSNPAPKRAKHAHTQRQCAHDGEELRPCRTGGPPLGWRAAAALNGEPCGGGLLGLVHSAAALLLAVPQQQWHQQQQRGNQRQHGQAWLGVDELGHNHEVPPHHQQRPGVVVPAGGAGRGGRGGSALLRLEPGSLLPCRPGARPTEAKAALPPFFLPPLPSQSLIPLTRCSSWRRRRA